MVKRQRMESIDDDDDDDMISRQQAAEEHEQSICMSKLIVNSSINEDKV